MGAAVHVAALAQFGVCRRVDGGAEGADPVEARLPQGACIVAEEGEHQRFLRLEHLEAREGDNARNVAEDGDDKQEAAERLPRVPDDRWRTRRAAGPDAKTMKQSGSVGLFLAVRAFSSMKFPPLMGVEVIDLILKSYHFVR